MRTVTERVAKSPRRRDRVAAAGQCVAISLALVLGSVSIRGQAGESVSLLLGQNQYDVATDGRTFLLRQAAGA
jgi:hypothetical protein